MNPVWVVDDNGAVSASIAAFLQTEGIDATPLTEPDVAMGQLNTGDEPGLLILDLAMPGNGGNRILEYLSARPELSFPVILLTGDPSVIDRRWRGRIYHTLTKPMDELELLRHVRRGLNLRPNP